MSPDYENLDGMTIEGRLDYWRQRALRAEQANVDLRDVGRAKVFLMKSRGWDEPTAHRHIQKESMDQRRSAGDIARRILNEFKQAGETAANNG